MRAVEKEAQALCCCGVLGNVSDPLNGNRSRVKDLALKTKQSRILVPILLLAGCVTLGKLPSISGPFFCKVKIIIDSTYRIIVRTE